MIAILDYGVGNSGSIQNMIRRVGGKSVITSDRELLSSAKGYILPGVGSFDHGISMLEKSGLVDIIYPRVMEKNIPLLGICLGMQILFSSSEEGKLAGLGWINGSVKKFDFKDSKLKVPHMGWNVARPVINHPLFNDFEDEARFYFVHSYYVQCEYKENILASTEYGHPFSSAVCKDNIFGVQFHPEKSHRFGMMLFKNFLEICQC